jgi:hypothetical protein
MTRGRRRVAWLCCGLALTWCAWNLRTPPRAVVVVPPTPSTAVLIVADEYAQREYARTITSMRAYAAHNGYALELWDPWSDAQAINRVDCAAFERLLFRRHCIARCLLRDRYTLIAAVDADVVAVDVDRHIESLFLTPRQAVVHEERFHTGEVQANAYAVRRGAFADAYLDGWARMEARTPRGHFSGGDNGALHLHLLETLYGAGSPPAVQCDALWRAASSADAYDRYVGCALTHLFNATSADIRLVRRGHGFCRDLWVTEGRVAAGVDMWGHGLKSFDRMPGAALSVVAMRPLVAEADAVARRVRPRALLPLARVGDCWPRCAEYWSVTAHY